MQNAFVNVIFPNTLTYKMSTLYTFLKYKVKSLIILASGAMFASIYYTFRTESSHVSLALCVCMYVQIYAIHVVFLSKNKVMLRMLICSSRFSIYLGQPKATSLFNSPNLLMNTLCASSRLLLLKAASCHCQYAPWLPRSDGVSPAWGFATVA